MPPRSPASGDRDQAEQAIRSRRDLEAIGQLADELLPALIAKLQASCLGEIEVREGTWRARLRKPIDATAKPVRTEHASHAPGRVHGHQESPCEPEAAEEESSRIVARSPAVGVFNPSRELVVGMRVRSGDRIGAVDVLGVAHEVVAPVDGVIGSSLVEAGEAVEYGQELVNIDLPEPSAGSNSNVPAGRN